MVRSIACSLMLPARPSPSPRRTYEKKRQQHTKIQFRDDELAVWAWRSIIDSYLCQDLARRMYDALFEGLGLVPRGQSASDCLQRTSSEASARA